MCNKYFDPKDLENQVNSRSGGNADEQSPEDGDNGNNGGNNSGGCGSDLGANNNTGGSSCPSHKGHIEPQPNWGVGGLSIDNPKKGVNN